MWGSNEGRASMSLGGVAHVELSDREMRSDLRVTPTPLFILFLGIFRVLSPWLGIYPFFGAFSPFRPIFNSFGGFSPYWS